MIDFSTEEWPTPLPPNSAEREARVSEVSLVIAFLILILLN